MSTKTTISTTRWKYFYFHVYRLMQQNKLGINREKSTSIFLFFTLLTANRFMFGIKKYDFFPALKGGTT